MCAAVQCARRWSDTRVIRVTVMLRWLHIHVTTMSDALAMARHAQHSKKHTLDMEMLRFWCQLCRFRASPEPKTAQNQTVTKRPVFVTKGPFFVTKGPFFVTNA